MALYGVVHGLTQRLRSVFVPYFRYLLGGAVALLQGQAAAEALQPKKKRRKSKAPEPAPDAASSADASAVLNTWRLRFRVRPPLVSARRLAQWLWHAVGPESAWHAAALNAAVATHLIRA